MVRARTQAGAGVEAAGQQHCNALCGSVQARATIRLVADPSVWKMLVLAALPLGLALTLNEIYLRADTLIISLYRTDREVGLYGLAWRIYELD